MAEAGNNRSDKHGGGDRLWSRIVPAPDIDAASIATISDLSRAAAGVPDPGHACRRPDERVTA